MALHIKSTKSFKILIGFSALLISGMAATFSITGIATLFSGYFFTVALMMGALEFAKIVVASFLARYWNTVSRILRGYFIGALLVLILITSGGIFGYLSDAYQRTKGDYTIVEKQTTILQTKKNFFLDKKNRLQADRDLELRDKQSNQTRVDSLNSRRQSVTKTRSDITLNNQRIAELEKQISVVEDSIGSYDLQIVNLESKNIQGELGPLKYIAVIFNTDMDSVVKYFIFMLIFVFDPLAVLLFVSLNTIIRKEGGMYVEDEKPKEEVKKIEEAKPAEDIKPIEKIEEAPSDPIDIEEEEIQEPQKNINTEEFVEDLVKHFDESNQEITEDKKIEKEIEDEIIENVEGIKDEHEFYHDKPESIPITKKSSNYHPQK